MYNRNIKIRIGSPLTPMVKKIMIFNGVIFIVQQFFNIFSPGFFEQFFGLNHLGFIHEFKIWQIFTYMFLHGSWMHIFFNLIALWMFAGELEELWGGKLFLKYYLYSGLGAGLFIAFMNYISFNQYEMAVTTIGASGAIYALLLAYGLTWPDREVLLYFVFPVKIKYLVLGFGLIEFFGTLSNATGHGTNISHIGHFGGLVSGFFFMQRIKKENIKKRSQKIKEAKEEERLHKEKILSDFKKMESRLKAKRIIDDLLDKIAREGMDSLTDDEKKLLEWARRNYNFH